MANYPGATRPYPALADIQAEFGNQIESRRFRDATVMFCQRANIAVDQLVDATLDYLNGRTPPGIEDLAEFMRFLIDTYRLDDAPDSPTLYKAVKGIPFHSDGRIGYTFRRRRRGRERGVFFFLRFEVL